MRWSTYVRFSLYFIELTVLFVCDHRNSGLPRSRNLEYEELDVSMTMGLSCQHFMWLLLKFLYRNSDAIYACVYASIWVSMWADVLSECQHFFKIFPGQYFWTDNLYVAINLLAPFKSFGFYFTVMVIFIIRIDNDNLCKVFWRSITSIFTASWIWQVYLQQCWIYQPTNPLHIRSVI